jgi:hypothetical protein
MLRSWVGDQYFLIKIISLVKCLGRGIAKGEN